MHTRKRFMVISLCLLGIATLTLTNCKKSTSEETTPILNKENLSTHTRTSISVEQYVIMAQKEQSKSTQASRGDYYIDYGNTVPVRVGDSATKIYDVFYTKIYTDSAKTEFVGSLNGYVLDNEKVFNVLHLTDVESSGVINVSVSTLGGIYIGGWESDNGQISNIDSSYEDPGTDQHKISLKRWWRCVSDCIGDAIWACGTSRECISLLFLADVGTIPYMGPAGAFLGRRMIAIACSASCADNVNLDLIPEH